MMTRDMAGLTISSTTNRNSTAGCPGVTDTTITDLTKSNTDNAGAPSATTAHLIVNADVLIIETLEIAHHILDMVLIKSGEAHTALHLRGSKSAETGTNDDILRLEDSKAPKAARHTLNTTFPETERNNDHLARLSGTIVYRREKEGVLESTVGTNLSVRRYQLLSPLTYAVIPMVWITNMTKTKTKKRPGVNTQTKALFVIAAIAIATAAPHLLVLSMKAYPLTMVALEATVATKTTSTMNSWTGCSTGGAHIWAAEDVPTASDVTAGVLGWDAEATMMKDWTMASAVMRMMMMMMMMISEMSLAFAWCKFPGFF